MRFEDIHITGVGAQLGLAVATSAMVRRGAVSTADARRTRQRSVCVSEDSGPVLAVLAAREAVLGHERVTGLPPVIDVHLHAQMYDKPDFWSAACYVLDQLGVTGCGVTCEIGAMSNGAVLGVEIAASLLSARSDLDTALITVGDRFTGNRFARYRADHGVQYGDAGAALMLGREPGLARVVSAATCTDPVLEGLTRGSPPTTSTSTLKPVAVGANGAVMSRSGVDDDVIDVRARQRVWLREHGGVGEALRRNRAGVRKATRVALADAGITLEDARWILLPFLGYEAVRTRWYRPLGIREERAADTLTMLGLHLGHLGAADHIVGLRHLIATGSVTPGDFVVLASSGAGMTWTTVVLQIADQARHAVARSP